MRAIGAMLAAGLAAAVAGPAAAGSVYLVELADPPAAAYDGASPDRPAPRRPDGRFDAASAEATAYRLALRARQDAVLADVGRAPIHRYDTAANGFAVTLEPEEAAALRARPGVLSVVPDAEFQPDAAVEPILSTQTFMGLTGTSGLWNAKAGSTFVRGENVVIGVIDTGVQPENPSFYDRRSTLGVPVETGGTLAYGPPPSTWRGICQTGSGFSTADCNRKLIGARFFIGGFLATKRPLWNMEYRSPRDADGHGTHTASTAAGNRDARAVHEGRLLGGISGIAPRARIAAYKACWTFLDAAEPTGRRTSCMQSDLLAAIDRAVLDGVDVINYSISGSRTSFWDPVQVAFRNASKAGVFVAASAGNNGPGRAVAHPSPWVTTVGATTHPVTFDARVTLGNGAVLTGRSINRPATATRPLILASNAAAAGVALFDAQRCFAGSLDVAKVTGRIVVCDRGVTGRLDKSAEVRRAGGAGMILLNVPGGAADLNLDLHRVPTVHLPDTVYAVVRGYAATAGATASIGAATLVGTTVAPVMAAFSSRGPSFSPGFPLKPDIAAPGVDVIAAGAYLPATKAERDAIAGGRRQPRPTIQSLSGTSMAAPHVAGAAALLIQARPTWTPAMIQSAMITTAGTVKLPSGVPDPDINGYGAGFLRPTASNRPVLVHKVTASDYARYACTLEPVRGCESVAGLAATSLNTASYSGQVPGRTVFQRRITNVGTSRLTFKGAASLPGFTATVSPSSVTLSPGATAAVTVTVTNDGGVPFDAWRFGQVTWTSGATVVRSPLAAVATRFDAISEIRSRSASASRTYTARIGYAGPFAVTRTRLVDATIRTGTIVQRPQGGNLTLACFGEGTGTWSLPVFIDGQTLAFRFAIEPGDAKAGDDLDLYVFNAAGGLVAFSENVGANEVVTVLSPTAQTYRICVVGYVVPGTQPHAFRMREWVLGPAAAGRSLSLTPTVVPSPVKPGDRIAFRAGWSLGTSTGHYLAAIRYGDGARDLGTTLVSVDRRPAGAPEAAVARTTSVLR